MMFSFAGEAHFMETWLLVKIVGSGVGVGDGRC